MRRPSPFTSSPLPHALLLGAMFAAGCKRSTGGDVAKGESLFQEKCALCHATGSGGGQGPGLGGVVGRKAASTPFPYSPALHSSGATWNEATLDRFLESPASFAPGTGMPVATPDRGERRDVIAYLATLRSVPTTVTAPALASSGIMAPIASAGLRTGAAAFGNYSSDGPGVRRHITSADMPPPFATEAVRNAPTLVDPPAAATLHVPPGFGVARFAEGLTNPRALRVAPNGDVFVAETGAGRVRVLRARDGAPRPDLAQVFAEKLDHPFGLAFYPPGPSPAWLYVANNNAVVRFAYQNGDLAARSEPATVVAAISDTTGGHTTRDIAFSNDGKTMFVAVGSASNVAEGLAASPPTPLPEWEAANGLGAAWGPENRRADVLAFDPDGKNARHFANGIRNCVGLATEPTTGALWCSTNERDGLGDNLVPDYITRVQPGAFYGWPWYYIGNHEDPRQKQARPDLATRVTTPDVLLQPHSASLQLTFYEGAQFPAGYRGNAFAALHGSWNRAGRTGYKIIRVLVNEGVPTGEYEDFVTGFVVDPDHVWGRPVGVAVAHDGALLFSEDGNGTLWRVTYQRDDGAETSQPKGAGGG